VLTLLTVGALAVTGACSVPAAGEPAPTGTAAAAPTVATSPPRPSASGPLAVSTPVAPEASVDGSSASGSAAPPARPGGTGVTQRHTFAPSSITLSRDGMTATAMVDVIDTGPTGELTLPADPGQVGWWQSGALAGDAYGSVVLAGHIDSKDRGLGFFARLLGVRPGDEVSLTGGGYQQRYRVTETRDVPKASLATSTDTFSSTVAGRLVLLTCTGTWSPATHYPENLVVTAEPIGTPTPRA
jgi:hypothetical protein